MSIGAQSYTYNGLGDRVRVDKPTGTRPFVYDASLVLAGGRVIAEYGSSARDVKAEFIRALPPARQSSTSTNLNRSYFEGRTFQQCA
ncbi:hypothetical protein [Erythrobacter ani]|uniref:Uncharacterized protein n=1 Tax=Erythrobacter ani TaxID=2827235 RepID=A0ABS6SJF3_9SPHN|nr:hypothetical protein [Erythrobacter ani]MBV7265138.1 hypothetical protein [Erythrobacter ani]